MTLAFLVGAFVTYFDCFSTLGARIGRVPAAFVLNPLVVGLALVCGALAGIACWTCDRDPNGVISTVLGLKAPDPWNGIVVGGSILILIRSKFLNIKDSPVGGDYLYEVGRDIAIHDVNGRWTLVRSKFQNDNIQAALLDAHLEARIAALIASDIQARPAVFRARVEGSLAAVTEKRPHVEFGRTDASWDFYYRALIGVALDACGPAAVGTLPGFRRV